MSFKKADIFGTLFALGLGLGASFTGAAEWEYEGVKGPSHWDSQSPDYSACAHGHSQSPIDIASWHASQATSPAFHFTSTGKSWHINNDGHRIFVTNALNSTISSQGNTYTLREFHIHHPSEHRIAGRRYPLEIHYVHLTPAGHILVLAQFIELGKRDAALAQILNHLPSAIGIHDITESFRIGEMEPRHPARALHYSGSLTTPPCTEGVEWWLLETPISATAAQIAQIARVFPNNARPLQAPAGREVIEED